MNDGNERLERIERILEQVALTTAQTMARTQEQVAKSIEGVTKSIEETNRSTDRVAKRQEEMAARQQYHDEAFDRMDAEIKALRDAIDVDAQNIRALVRIAELHHQRLEDLEGGEPA